MAGNSARSAFGVVLKHGSTAVAELSDVVPPQTTVKTVNVTHHGSPSAFEEFIATVKNGGKIPIKGNWMPLVTGNFAVMRAYIGTVEAWTVEYLDGAKVVVNGILTTFGAENGGVEDARMISGEITVTGVPVWTDASA